MRVLKIKKMKRINRVQFTPDGSQLLVLGGFEVRGTDHVVRIDLATGDEFDRINVTAKAGAVSRDGTRVGAAAPYLGRAGGAVHWRAAKPDGEWHPVPASKGAAVVGIAFAPDGKRAAVGRIKMLGRRDDPEWQKSLAVWHLDTPAEVMSFRVSPDPIVIEFNADGSRVAVTGGIDGDPVVAVHDAATGAMQFEFKPKGTKSRGLAFDAAGRLAVVNSKWVYVLSPDGEVQFVLESPSKQMNAGVFSPDGRRILTGAHDGALRVWDAANGSPVKSFDWQIGPVTAVAFAPDGLTCAAAGMKGQVVLWDVDG